MAVSCAAIISHFDLTTYILDHPGSDLGPRLARINSVINVATANEATPI